MVWPMSETEPTAAQPEQPEQEPAAPVADRTRLRDLVFGLRALVAVALAGLILGGLTGFGIHAATDGDGQDGRMGRFGPGGGFQDGPGGPRGTRRPGWLSPGAGPAVAVARPGLLTFLRRRPTELCSSPSEG